MKKSTHYTWLLIGWILFGVLAGGQKSLAQQASIDQAYVEAIKAYTTDARFLPASLLQLPTHPTVPSPLEHFGHIIGTPGELHRLQEIYGYYEALAAASPHVQLQDMGETEEGRRFLLVVIGDAATLERLPHYKEQLAKLADPRSFPSEQLPSMLDDSKLVYYVNGGMHATETGSPEMLMELAYRLAIDDAPDIKQIREGIITVINPVSEPDGLEKQVEWYHRYTKQREVYDDGFPRSPPYWGKYVFHDNNRDGLQISQRITQSIFKGFFEFHPPVMLDLHESVPLLYVSTGTGPYNDYVDPITIGEWQVMANHDIATVAGQGMPGAWHWGFYDGWYPGYGIWVANNHNSTGRFYETYGNAGATTYLRDLSNSRYAGDPATSREWYRPEPPTQEVYWSFRNNINYTMVGVLASLHYGATNARQLLHNFYKKGVNSLEKGRSEGPRAFRIPKEQRDPAMAAYLAAQLQKQGIEVHEDANAYVLLSEQPYRNLLVSLLTPQSYPKEAKFPPYDAIAWTLPLLYGVEVEAVEEWTTGTQGLQHCTEPIRYAAKVSGSGRSYLIAHAGQQNLLGLLYDARSQHKNARFHQLTAAQDIDGETYPAGSLWIENVPAASMEKLASRWEVAVRGGDFAPEAGLRQQLTLPRVAIYHTWFNTQDEGWSRFTFEQRGIPYVNIDKDDLRKGG
ncbi:M14 family zinc carboxypeptidase [Nitritalea halalkaliphila]|uniref:M14 family zinc carboxypeptidase n=1 Tax=Nitritalea halalkaliphila TaxID=590849 RepID=UPI0002D371A5|nr:M14 family zinc carboxypeptidase [Nitritalea halalkaliphila]